MQIKRNLYFLTSAAVTGLIYICILFLTRDMLHLGVYASVSIAYLSAMTFYFITNKLVIFRNTAKGAALHKQIWQFAIMIIVNYLITLLLVRSIRTFTGEIYSGSITAGIITTLLAYLVFNRIFK